MKNKNILVLAGIKFRSDEIEQELAKSNKFIVKWKTIWEICYSQAQRQYYAIKVYTSEDSYVSKGRFYFVNASRANEMIGSEIFID
ncbi:hypothetical protein GAS36_00995 [Phocaeicola vulgatus]|jgi:hypothetical protein|uniref:Uncharacterized protein n=1 Tax=Phocaeicola vulgatus TaxID=821 RepID=A0A6I0HHJ0_PHOVU|nr:hypothetical protein [Phocaeicola vulgatus]KAB3860201.1 hypothetical protein GAS29_00995 [Phocaeicola vulgatus]KAB3870878.1 hypothetical protein GAS07_00695 [Phocaeicola vulgatus]KAB3872632.1 hypothetical protein GAS14_01805 [Phocaeicola vulgatus]KAB3886933.1 hypothetical protein GAS24_00020 [Phocaeicola vulgatus]KAB3887514.1 hypothetical protein GAS36_00995 [Phocaeicola vulgatus]